MGVSPQKQGIRNIWQLGRETGFFEESLNTFLGIVHDDILIRDDEEHHRDAREQSFSRTKDSPGCRLLWGERIGRIN
ncbi:hypothetical protein JTE90_029469 [Oedothorax gibbosus]|uniref:Uncharacterized protein n=1 Tax=Oedothorax gibbosus TaxID=931172 RepID=A0AAV6V5R8_9ARAC|nr:hypothetical protein JTE90_029469 [Oedothorax gibbosus]